MMQLEEAAAKARVITFIQAELKKKAILLSYDTVEAMIDAYGLRIDQGPPY
jgi:hypothetical protein